MRQRKTNRWVTVIVTLVLMALSSRLFPSGVSSRAPSGSSLEVSSRASSGASSGISSKTSSGISSGISSKASSGTSSGVSSEASSEELQVSESGSYTSKEEVAAYLRRYDHLPDNFITKKEAKKLGWVSSEGNLDEVAPGKSIGGDHFGNYEGDLPEKKGRDYFECDIDYDGGYRGEKRIIFSDDGLIYYTQDHYQTFDLLYGD